MREDTSALLISGAALVGALAAAVVLTGPPGCDTAPRYTGPLAPQPLLPDGGDTWRTTDGGVRVTTRRIPKVPGRTVRVSETTLRVLPDGNYALEGEDAHAWYVRIEAPPPASAPDAGAGSELEVLVEQTGAAWRAEDLASGLPRRGQWRNGFDVMDIDGDGDRDVVSGPARKGARSPQLWRNDGAGRFTPWREAAIPSGPYDYGDAAAADFDGDGRIDVALAIHLGGLVVLAQVAPGRFELRTDGLPAPTPGGTTGFSSRAVGAGDWDGDGKADVVALSDGPRPPSADGRSGAVTGLQVFLARGERFERTALPGDVLFGDGLATGDVDGDGRADALATSSRAGATDVLRLARSDGMEARRLPLPGPNTLVGAAALVDLDGNGRLDAVLGMQRSRGGAWEHLLVTVEDPAGSARVRALALPNRITALAATTTENGVELAAALEDGTLRMWRHDERGLHAVLTVAAAEWRRGCRPWHLVLADVDGRRGTELLASFAGEVGSPGTELEFAL